MAVYWIGAATMTFTATVVLLSLLWPLLAPPRWRGPGAVALQLFALGCSEHAVVVPALLACLVWLGPARATLRETVRLVALPVAVTALYLGLKLAYLFYAGFPHSAHTPVADVAAWVTNLGRFGRSPPPACRRWPWHAIRGPARRGRRAGRAADARGAGAPARGRLGVWAASALGYSSAPCCRCRSSPITSTRTSSASRRWGRPWWSSAPVGAAARRRLGGGGAGGRVPGDRPAHLRPGGQADSNVALLHTAGSRDLLRSLDYTARRAPGRFVHVPDTPLNMSVVGFGGANRVFFDPPVSIHYGSAPDAEPDPNPVPLLPAPPDVPMPGADPAWDWLRRLAPAVHAHYAGECG
ncbi:MAG: hypothetical protein U0802_08680 [Candidatus Binatia bacterium]